MAGTAWALLPPVVAIALALITKEVYLSLLIGILSGALLITGFNPLTSVETTFTIMGEKIGADYKIRGLQGIWKLGIQGDQVETGSAAFHRAFRFPDFCG